MSPVRQRGQAIVEFALVAPVILLLLLGLADVGIAGFQLLRMQNAAATIAAVPEAEAVELARLGMDCAATASEAEGVRLVRLECIHPLPLTGLLAKTLQADASAPMGDPPMP